MGTTRAVALSVAFVWSAVILIGAFTAPAYSSDGSGGGGSQTLVGETGIGVGIVMAIPLAITVVVSAMLWRRRLAAGPGAVAWTLTGLLAALNLLGMLTIGIFVLPVTVAVVVACLQPRGVAHRAT